jgi:hypothetical protein
MKYEGHPLEITPLVFGLVFLGIVAGWALFAAGVVSGGDSAWVMPIVLISAGALGLVVAATRPRRTDAHGYTAKTDTETPEPHDD